MKNPNHFNWRQLRHKENKTKEDELLLEYWDAYFLISEILVDHSKLHISDTDCIEKIRKVMQNVRN